MKHLQLILLTIFVFCVSQVSAQVSNFAFGGNSGLSYQINDGVNFGSISLSPGFSFDFGSDKANNAGLFFGFEYSFFEETNRNYAGMFNPYYQRYILMKPCWNFFLRVDLHASFGAITQFTGGGSGDNWTKIWNTSGFGFGVTPGLKFILNEGKSSVSIGVDLVNFFQSTWKDSDNSDFKLKTDAVVFGINKNPLSLEYMVILGSKGSGSR